MRGDGICQNDRIDGGYPKGATDGATSDRLLETLAVAVEVGTPPGRDLALVDQHLTLPDDPQQVALRRPSSAADTGSNRKMHATNLIVMALDSVLTYCRGTTS